MPLHPVLEDLDLPGEVAGRVWNMNGGTKHRPFHRHAELELNIALGGSATYLVGSERVKLVRRSLLWLHPAQNHLLIEESGDFSMTIAVWKPDFLRAVCQSDSSQILLCADPGLARCKRVGEDDFATLQSVIAPLETARDDLLGEGLGFLLHLAQRAFERADESPAHNAVHPCVERAAHILRDQSPPPSVPELARQVGLSASRLSRLFKVQTGTSLSEFRARQCHERALRLLESELPLSLIAERAGFGSYAQFHRTFCQRQGQNPARFRREKAGIEKALP